VVGIALGTALGAWVNVGVLVWMALGRDLLSVSAAFWRSLGPILLAAALTGAGALVGADLGGMLVPQAGLLRDVALLGLAILVGGTGYLLTILVFRRVLPVGFLTRGQ
jgi:putative peptidoglycan lipid II flippase